MPKIEVEDRTAQVLLLIVGLTDVFDQAGVGEAVEGQLVILGGVGLGGWFILLPTLRIFHLLVGFRDMGPVDLLTSLTMTLGNIVVGAAVLAAVFKGVGDD